MPVGVATVSKFGGDPDGERCEQIEVVGLPPLLDHPLTWHRRLRMHAVADVEVDVDVRLRRNGAHVDHGSGPW